MRAMTYNLKNLQKAFTLDMPARFLSFVENKEFKPYNKRSLSGLEFSSYGVDRCSVLFANRNLFDDNYYAIDQTACPGVVPLAILDDKGSMQFDFIGIDLRTEEMPVVWFKADDRIGPPASAHTTYRPLEPSLDAFLARLEA